MTNTAITIGGHLIERILCDENGASITLPPLYPTMYQFKLKLVTIGEDGEPVVVFPYTSDPEQPPTFGMFQVEALSASIGLIYAEPRAGTFKLRYGPSGTPTDTIEFNEDAEDFRTKLAALTESTSYQLNEVYQPTPSTWMCKFDNPDPLPIPLEGVENELEPETFVRVRQFSQGGEYWAEIRLLQGPIASTSAHDTMLADPPTVREIRRGYTDYPDMFTTIVVNEIQSIDVPPGFAGTYIVKFQGRQTRPLSVNDGAANIQSALNSMFTDNQTRFTVTNPEANSAYVEFVGPFRGMPFDLFEIIVSSQGHSSLSFQLDLNTTEVADALRNKSSVEATFEIMLSISDPTIVGDVAQDLVLFQAPVTILRPLHWEGLVAAAPINWLFPPNPKDYIPFDVNQVVTGLHSYSIPIGDGALSSFSIDHMLNSDALVVSVRENQSDGRLLTDNEYGVTFDNANALTLTFSAAPASNALVVLIIAHPPISTFVNHTHPIEQISGLSGIIDEILVRLSALEAYIPTVAAGPPPGPAPFGGDTSKPVMNVTIPDIWNVVPTNRLPGKDKPTAADTSKLPSAGFLLPAVHEAINLGTFTADPSTDLITLDTAYAGTPALVDGQRVRIDVPATYDPVGNCAFDDTADTVLLAGHGLVLNRRIQFSGEGLPSSIARNLDYYVINPTTDTFQVSSTPSGDFLPITDDWDSAEIQYVSVRPEPPGGLSEGVDYFMITPTATTFKLSETLNGTAGVPIDITSAGYPPGTMTTINDAPAIDPLTNHLPDPTDPQYYGNAYSVRQQVQLLGGRGIRASVVNPGDIIACDGRLWYPVTRSDSPAKNSFYPVKMENEIFRLAISDKMLAAGMVLTVTFSLEIRMYKHISNIQYLLVVEYADLPQTLIPSPTGPNLYGVIWNKVPILQQRIIATELSFLHDFGVQVVRLVDGRMRTNKKIYGVQVAGDSIPPTANFALRSRLIEFDTEDNVKGATGLVYYSVSKAIGAITVGTPTELGTGTS